MDRLPDDDFHQPGLSLRWLPRAVMVVAIALLLQGLMRISASPNPHNTLGAQIIEPGLLPLSLANLAAIEASLANIFAAEQDAGLILNSETEKYLTQAYELFNERTRSAPALTTADDSLPEALIRSFPGNRGIAVLQLFNCYQAYKSAETRAAKTHLAEVNRGNALLDYRPLQDYFFTPALSEKLFANYEAVYASLANQPHVNLIAIAPERGNTPYPRSCKQLKHNEFF